MWAGPSVEALQCFQNKNSTHAHAVTHVSPPPGRKPNTHGLGLEAAGVKLGAQGEITVDEYCRTSVPSIWAVGDVINRIQVSTGPANKHVCILYTVYLLEVRRPSIWAVGDVINRIQVSTGPSYV